MGRDLGPYRGAGRARVLDAMTDPLAHDRSVRLTNPDRVYFPARGETKLDLARYYLAVADGIVRALRDRPCMLHRFPTGVTGEKVHQKRLPKGAPEWVRTVRVHFPRWDRTADELCAFESINRTTLVGVRDPTQAFAPLSYVRNALKQGLVEEQRIGMNPFRLDSPRPRIPLEEYRYNEVRFKALAQTHPDAAKRMLEQSQRGILERYQVYEDLASRDGSRFHPA